MTGVRLTRTTAAGSVRAPDGGAPPPPSDSVRSTPPENAGSAPVRTTTRVPGSASAARTARMMPRRIAMDRALRVSGRSSTRSRTPSAQDARSPSTSSVPAPSWLGALIRSRYPVDVDRGAGEVGRTVGEQERHQLTHLVRLPGTLERHLHAPLLDGVAVERLGLGAAVPRHQRLPVHRQQRGVHHAWADAVGTDAAVPVRLGDVLGQA